MLFVAVVQFPLTLYKIDQNAIIGLREARVKSNVANNPNTTLVKENAVIVIEIIVKSNAPNRASANAEHNPMIRAIQVAIAIEPTIKARHKGSEEANAAIS